MTDVNVVTFTMEAFLLVDKSADPKKAASSGGGGLFARFRGGHAASSSASITSVENPLNDDHEDQGTAAAASDCAGLVADAEEATADGGNIKDEGAEKEGTNLVSA